MTDVSKLTVKELQEELESRNINFAKKAKKAELVALLEKNMEADDQASATAVEPAPDDQAAPLADDISDKGGFAYAVVRTGGKQYQVSVGDTLQVEKLAGNEGDTVELTDVLILGGDNVYVGQPVVSGARVVATIAAQGRSRKVVVFKKKRRKGYKVKHGHRQHYTALTIDKIIQN